jgi:ketosteroid isomerase-like protein
MAQSGEDRVRQANAAFGSGDLDALSQFLAEDVEWHVPGRGPLAGDYQGIAEVIALFGKVSELSGARPVSRCTTFWPTAIT